MSDTLDYRKLERELEPLGDDEIAKMLRDYEVEDCMLATAFCKNCGDPTYRKKCGSRREALIEAVRLQLNGTSPGKTQLCESCAIERCIAADIHDDLNVGGFTQNAIVPGRKDGRSCFKNWSGWLEGDSVCYVAESAILAAGNAGRFLSGEEAEKVGWRRDRLIEMCGGRTRLAELVLERAEGQEPQDILSAFTPDDMKTVGLREALDSISCHKVRFASLPSRGMVTVAEIWADEMEEVYLAFDSNLDLDEDEISLLARRCFPFVDEVTSWKTVPIAEFCEEHTAPRSWRYYPRTANQLEEAIARVVKSTRKGGDRR